MKPKILVLELWGLGDLTLSTPLLREASDAGCEIHLSGKDHAASLLQPSFPSIRFHPFDAPWTRYRGKYRLWRWHWLEIASWVRRLHREKFDAIFSVRNDPRDHFFMMLMGGRRRFGFPIAGSSTFLTDPVVRSRAIQHKVEDWRDLATAMGFEGKAEPALDHAAYRSPRVDALFYGIRRPVVCLHTGARITTRRWPIGYFKALLELLRREFDFHLLLIPDLDGYGAELEPLADTTISDLAIPELVDLLGRVDFLLCNDSGPAHLAAACGRPTVTFFGPSAPEWFRPFGEDQKVLIRDICPWRPCFDYCHFPEPYCMTKLLPDFVWPEVRDQILHLVEKGKIPPSILNPAASFK